MTIAEVAQVRYVERQIWLDDKAREIAPTMPLSARVVRNYARIAYGAAKAEQTNPEPGVRPCGICRGVQACDWMAHLARAA